MYFTPSPFSSVLRIHRRCVPKKPPSPLSSFCGILCRCVYVCANLEMFHPDLLHDWVYALVVKGWSDLALVCDDTQFEVIDCSRESEGLVPNGWACLFSSMPHLCRFRTKKVRPPKRCSGFLLSGTLGICRERAKTHCVHGLSLLGVPQL